MMNSYPTPALRFPSRNSHTSHVVPLIQKTFGVLSSTHFHTIDGSIHYDKWIALTFSLLFSLENSGGRVGL
jgi:hypothetical protein